MGLDWFPALGLHVRGILSIATSKLDKLYTDYADVFSEGLGCYVGTPISFNVDASAVPVRLKLRRVPFAVRPKLDQELDKLINQRILEPVDFAKWETPIVTLLKKDGSLCICVDYKVSINKYLHPSMYPVPVIQHLLHSFEPGTTFAKLDMSQPYQQLPVDDVAADLQTY
uniref:Reverse transcriptase domain-containing protein n=1 Tax=Micrurus carvalhoi TaxID=3147026 RepID=A0A2H6N299_9SAUR